MTTPSPGRPSFQPVGTAAGATDADGDAGRAIIEVIWLAVLVLVPVVYILASVLTLQSASFAVAQAAREAARALDLSPSLAIGEDRASTVVQQALADHNVAAQSSSVKYVSIGADCDSGAIAPDLTPGSSFDVCVTAPVVLPLLPEGLTASNTVTGVYTYHVGEFREAR